MKNHVAPEDYEAYKRVRKRFKKQLRSVVPTGWRVSGRSVQVAKAVLRIEGLTSQQAAMEIAGLIGTMEEAVDGLLPHDLEMAAAGGGQAV